MRNIAIEVNAFNTKAMNKLNTLFIDNLLHIIDYHADMLMGLVALYELVFFEPTDWMVDFPSKFLHHLQERLDMFTYEGTVGIGPMMTNLFGSIQMLLLRTLAFDLYRK